MKLPRVVTECLPDVGTPALLQFSPVGFDQMFYIDANYALVGLIQHSLRDTKTVFSSRSRVQDSEERFSVYLLFIQSITQLGKKLLHRCRQGEQLAV